MTGQRSTAEILADILDAARKAVAFLGTADLAAFVEDEKSAYAVARALEIIGEATKRLPNPFRDEHPVIPWRSMAGIRDKIIHDYVNVDSEVLWRTVTEDLPVLIERIEQLLADHAGIDPPE